MGGWSVIPIDCMDYETADCHSETSLLGPLDELRWKWYSLQMTGWPRLKSFVCSRQSSATKVNMAKFTSALVSIAFLTCFLTKGERHQIGSPSVTSIFYCMILEYMMASVTYQLIRIGNLRLSL